MLQPSRTKYRKQFRGRMRGQSAGNLVAFGEYGLKSLSCGWISSNQIEAARKSISHATKRNGRLWIRVFPDKPITQKGAGAPLGAGKGDVKGYVAVIRPGRVMFEVSGISDTEAHRALNLAAAKLSVSTKVIKRL